MVPLRRAAAMFSLLATTFACVPAAVAAAAPRTILFGAAMSLTGVQAREGKLTREGYDFWAQYVNAHGGLQVGNTNYPIEIKYLDDRSSPPVTAADIEKLISDDHVDFILGPYGSAEAFAAAAVTERHGVPMVTTGSAAERTFNQGYRFIFGVQSPARKYLAGIVEYAVHRSPRPQTVAISGAEDPFSREIAQGGVQSANDHGLRVVYSGRYQKTAESINSVAAAIVALHPDIVLNAGHFQDALDMHKALVANHADAKMYGYSVGPDTPQFRTVLGATAQAVLGSAQWSPAVSYLGAPGFYRTSAAYTAAYVREFGHPPTYLMAEATAGGLAYQYALAAAGSLDHAAVRDALARLNVSTFFGQLRFDDRGVNMYKPMVVNQIQGDTLVTIYPYRLANAKGIYPTPPWSAAEAAAIQH